MKSFWRIFAVISVIVLTFSVLTGCNAKKSEIPVGEIMANATVGNVQEIAQGTTVEGAAQAVSAAAGEATIMPAAAEALTNVPYVAPTLKEIQTALKNAGYYTGAIDGKIGPKSTKAIEAFQNDNGLTVDGKVGSKTWNKLRAYLNKATEPAAENTQAIAD
jgi:peptidoglycan hydrolase-like protein with peptidoglycan-binding domain